MVVVLGLERDSVKFRPRAGRSRALLAPRVPPRAPPLAPPLAPLRRRSAPGPCPCAGRRAAWAAAPGVPLWATPAAPLDDALGHARCQHGRPAWHALAERTCRRLQRERLQGPALAERTCRRLLREADILNASASKPCEDHTCRPPGSESEPDHDENDAPNVHIETPAVQILWRSGLSRPPRRSPRDDHSVTFVSEVTEASL